MWERTDMFKVLEKKNVNKVNVTVVYKCELRNEKFYIIFSLFRYGVRVLLASN